MPSIPQPKLTGWCTTIIGTLDGKEITVHPPRKVAGTQPQELVLKKTPAIPVDQTVNAFNPINLLIF